MELFIQEGLDTPLEVIASRAGVSIGTLYNRFGGRAGLLGAVVSDVAQERLRTQLALAQAQQGSWQRFAAFVEGVCEFQVPDPEFSDELSGRYCEAAKLLAVSDSVLGLGEDLIHAAQREGALRPDFSRDDLYHVIWSLGSLVRDRVGDNDGRRRNVQFVLDGLRERPPLTTASAG